MGREALENLARIGQLSAEPFSPAEYAKLLQSGRTRLNDARRSDLSLASRFDLAYNAGHALALAALRRFGFRSANRVTVFQSLAHTTSLAPEIQRLLVRAHGMRNAAEYEGELPIDARLLEEIINAVTVLELAAS